MKQKRMFAVTALMALADINLKTQLQAAGINTVSDNVFAAALQEAVADQQKEAVKNAANEVLAMFGAAQEQITDHVASVRELRREVDSRLASIQAINRAKMYGEATNNFLPLAALLGAITAVSPDKMHLCVVPANWKPTVKETVANKPSPELEAGRALAKLIAAEKVVAVKKVALKKAIAVEKATTRKTEKSFDKAAK